jgi:GNAT superfamily N-acetyltransferase
MARLNELAYGYPKGDFAAVAEARMPGLRIYFGDLDGEAVSTLAIWPHGSDAVVIWVATAPEARGRGISARLLAHALRDARDAGLETTTLQSTKLGNPVYAKLGYRDFGAAHMWERRK